MRALIERLIRALERNSDLLEAQTGEHKQLVGNRIRTVVRPADTGARRRKADMPRAWDPIPYRASSGFAEDQYAGPRFETPTHGGYPGSGTEL